MTIHDATNWCWLLILAAVALFTLLMTGCHQRMDNENRWRTEAALAIAEAELVNVPAPSQPIVGKMNESESATSSTNITPSVRERRILYFGSPSCPACRVAEQSLRLLAEAGWHVGPGPENHIQTIKIDFTQSPRPVARRFQVRAFPTWILLVDGRVAARCVGVLDPFAVGRFFAQGIP